MKTIYRFYKNSNTGDLMMSQKFEDTPIRFPVYYYDVSGKSIGEDIQTKGFVEISEKKWNRYKRKEKTNR